MIRLVELLISAVLTVVLFVIIGLFLPDHAHVERKLELGNPITQTYDILNGFKRYNLWQPWALLDQRQTYAFEGPEYGVGAKMGWNSVLNAQVGQGSLEVVESVPDEKVVMALENNWRGRNKTFTFSLDQNPQTNAVTLTWAIDVDYGWDLLGRYAGLYLNGRVGELMNEGLGRLATIMATIPNVDYSQAEIQIVDAAPMDSLYVSVGVPAAPRLWDEAEVKMEAGWTEIENFVKRNKLQQLGPRRRTIYVLGEENHEFDLAIPVAPHTAPVVGNIRVGRTYGGKALTTQYRGHRVGLNKARDMLKAYAMTHGYRFDRDLVGLYEEWIDETTEIGDPITTLYLPIQ
jgi:hypothetical protein